MPGFLPSLFAFVAMAEGSHDVSVYVGGFSTSVVLAHHSATGVPHDAIHQHGKLAALLCAIATDHSGDPDHEATFASGTETDEHQQRNLADSADCMDAPFFPATHVVKILSDFEVFALPFIFHPDPLDHAPPAFLAGLGSTLLLI